MDSFIFAVNAVLPLIIIVCIGYVLKQIGFMSDNTPKELNKVLFRVFLPCMLFVNIYDMEGLANVDFGYIIYAIAAVFVIFFSAIPIVMSVTKSGARRGVLLQSVFRSNFALIGLSLVSSLCGDAAIGTAALLSAFAIPVFNVFAVISLSVFMDSEGGINVKKILLDIAKNPLIISVLVGVIVLLIRALFVKWNIEWRLSNVDVIFKVLRNLSSISTPIALIALGAQFKFSAVKGMSREIIFSVLARLVVVPSLTIFILRLCTRTLRLVYRALRNTCCSIERAYDSGNGRRHRTRRTDSRMDHCGFGNYDIPIHVHPKAFRSVLTDKGDLL